MKQTFLTTLFSTILAVFLFMMPFLVMAQEPPWSVKLKQMEWMNKVNKIELLKTNKAEVEQILGKPENLGYETADWVENYNIENGRITITYTTQECVSKYGKVNEGVVEEISFDPKQDILFSNLVSNLKIPIKQFKKTKDSHTPLLIYGNEKHGITFTVQHIGTINPIDFSPPKWMNFGCPS